ncbi:MAG: SIS domain-containing protein [Gammaproteobacteria bacterium]|nr:SIS domain-containing protein [Gammaproteobacteria bacterium]MBT6331757.1 SIS domain-containing protein [Gammaproteobacteria bacterium]
MNRIDGFFTENIEQFSKSYFSYLKEIIDKVDLSEIKIFVELLLSARKSGATIFFIGNGGSAATASHFANDLAFGTHEHEKPFKAISITDNVSVLTALGNDYGYGEIFVRQLKVYAEKGDVVVGISASGNSKNLINAFNYAKSSGIKTMALTAFDGGQMKVIADNCIHIPTEDKEYGPAEDVHMILDHLISSYLMRIMRSA